MTKVDGYGLKVTDRDNRGTEDYPYGFVYFNDGKRLVYADYTAKNGTGGWAPVTDTHKALAAVYLTLEAYEFGREIMSPEITHTMPDGSKVTARKPVIYHAKDANDPEPWASDDGELFRHDQVMVAPKS